MKHNSTTLSGIAIIVISCLSVIEAQADLTMKENALKKLQDPSLKGVRYQVNDSLLAFLESL